MKRFAQIILIILVMGPFSAAFGRSRLFEGKAIAYSSGYVIYNDYVYANLLVLKSRKHQNEIICVRLSVIATEWNEWIEALSSIRRFHLKPAKVKEFEVIEHENVINGATGENMAEQYPRWSIITGMENIQIPFGKHVAAYDSLDWPIRPVI